MRNEGNSNKKNKSIAIVILLFLILGVGGYFLYMNNTVNKYSEVIYPGVKIQGYDVGGMKKEEALNFIRSKYEKILDGTIINLVYKDSK